MPLDDLVSVIETLQQRIRDHGESLRQNEYRTRVALIDPLLTALGWDVADPCVVMPEYDVSGKRADYALLDGQREPCVFLEAKRLDEGLSNHRSQVVAYASELGIKYPALSNGNDWEVYDNSRLVPIEQRRILGVSIAGTESAKAALQFLLLWRSNLASGEPVAANEPLLGVEIPVDDSSATEQHQGQQTPPIRPGAGWTSLATFEAVPGTTPPPLVRFDSGEERSIYYWKTLLVEVAEWLVRKGTLTPNCCPVSSPADPSVRLVHITPEHADGTRIYNPNRLTNGLFLASHGSARALVRRSKQIVEGLGQDPGSVWLKVE